MKTQKLENGYQATWNYEGQKIHAIGPTRAAAWAALIEVVAGMFKNG